MDGTGQSSGGHREKAAFSVGGFDWTGKDGQSREMIGGIKEHTLDGKAKHVAK
jgi:hypothetical protein